MSEEADGSPIELVAEFSYPPSVARTTQMIEAKRVAEMIHVLPALIADEGLHPIARQACVETYFTSVRGLIEFLEVSRPPKRVTSLPS